MLFIGEILLKHYFFSCKLHFPKLPKNLGRFIINDNSRENVLLQFHNDGVWKKNLKSYSQIIKNSSKFYFPKTEFSRNLFQIIVFVWLISFHSFVGSTSQMKIKVPQVNKFYRQILFIFFGPAKQNKNNHNGGVIFHKSYHFQFLYSA